jgi:hypothetical protein
MALNIPRRSTLVTIGPDRREIGRVVAGTSRAEIKALLKTGSLTLAEVFEQAEVDDIVAGTKVYPLLASLPRMGKIKAIRLTDELGIPENRKIRGLGSRQRENLLNSFA